MQRLALVCTCLVLGSRGHYASIADDVAAESLAALLLASPTRGSFAPTRYSTPQMANVKYSTPLANKKKRKPLADELLGTKGYTKYKRGDYAKCLGLLKNATPSTPIKDLDFIEKYLEKMGPRATKRFRHRVMQKLNLKELPKGWGITRRPKQQAFDTIQAAIKSADLAKLEAALAAAEPFEFDEKKPFMVEATELKEKLEAAAAPAEEAAEEEAPAE
jgi:hypothetical protein